MQDSERHDSAGCLPLSILWEDEAVRGAAQPAWRSRGSAAAGVSAC